MFFRVQLRPPFAITAMGAERMLETFAPGARHMLPFHLVTRGPIWFDVAGSESVSLDAGDIIVLPHGADHCLTHEPGTPAVPVAEILHEAQGSPPLLEWGGGGEPTGALCGFFHFSGQLFNPLLSALPEVLIVRHDPARSPWLTATLERTFDETLEERPGGGGGFQPRLQAPRRRAAGELASRAAGARLTLMSWPLGSSCMRPVLSDSEVWRVASSGSRGHQSDTADRLATGVDRSPRG
jgi:hypothetical protein